MALYIAGQDIAAGSNIVCSAADGKLYAAGTNAPSYSTFVGKAVETIREGLRVLVSNGEAREDDA